MLNALVTLIFSYVLLFNGAFNLHDLSSGITSGVFKEVSISGETKNHPTPNKKFHHSNHHVEVNEEEEEDNEENNQWDDKISGNKNDKYRSLFSNSFLIPWPKTDHITQRLHDVWRPPQNS